AATGAATGTTAAAAAEKPLRELIASRVFHAACMQQHCAVCGEVVGPSEAYVRLPDRAAAEAAAAAAAAATTGKTARAAGGPAATKAAAAAAAAAKNCSKGKVQHARCTRCSTCGESLNESIFITDGSGGVQHK